MLRLALRYAKKATDAAVVSSESEDGREWTAGETHEAAARAWNSALALRAAIENGLGHHQHLLRRTYCHMMAARRLAGL